MTATSGRTFCCSTSASGKRSECWRQRQKVSEQSQKACICVYMTKIRLPSELLGRAIFVLVQEPDKR